MQVRTHRCGLLRCHSHGRGAGWLWWVRRGRSVTRHSLQPRNRGLGECPASCDSSSGSAGSQADAQAIATFEAVNNPRCGVCCQICCNRNTGSAQYTFLALSIVCRNIAPVLQQTLGYLHHCTIVWRAYAWCTVQRGERQHQWTGFHRSSGNVQLHSAGLHQPATRSLQPPSRGGCCTSGASSRCADDRPASC